MTDETTARDRAIEDAIERAWTDRGVPLPDDAADLMFTAAEAVRALAAAPTADVAEDRIVPFLRDLANDRHPYGPGPFDADHIKVFKDDARRLLPLLSAAPEGVDAADEPIYRHAREQRPGEPVDPAADLARYDALLAETPEDYPGRGLMLAHREVLARTAELTAASEGVDAADEQGEADTGNALDRAIQVVKAHGYNVVRERTYKEELSKLYERGRELTAAQAAIQRVRDLHVTGDYPDVCDECDHGVPCPTVRALDGDTTEEGR